MGINRLPNYALFWSTDDFFGNHGIKRTMPKNRYEELVSYPHFNDSSQEPARGDANYDRLYKVTPIFDYILNKCKTNFKPTKNTSGDEGMFAFRVGYLSGSIRPPNQLSTESKFGWQLIVVVTMS